jgi:hypothetical protein
VVARIAIAYVFASDIAIIHSNPIAIAIAIVIVVTIVIVTATAIALSTSISFVDATAIMNANAIVNAIDAGQEGYVIGRIWISGVARTSGGDRGIRQTPVSSRHRQIFVTNWMCLWKLGSASGVT